MPETTSRRIYHTPLICTQLSEHSIECSLQCLSQAPKHHLDPGQQQGIPMARRLPPPIMGLSTGIPMARRLRPQSGSHPKAGSLEPPVPAKGSDSSPNAYRKTSIARGSTSIVHISSEPYNVLISAKNPVVCTQLYRIIQGFHKR